MPSASALILNADPRGKLFLGILLGALAWSVSLPVLGAYALFCILVLWCLPRSGGVHSEAGPGSALRTYLFFVLFWMSLKWGMDMLSGQGALQALGPALILGARLAVLLLVGLVLAAAMSVRQMTMAVTWAARPVLRSRAWQAGLALSLMVHFLPLTWKTVSEVRRTIRVRVPQLSFRQRLTVVPVAVMRALAQKTWNQSLAIVARGMDRPQAWKVELSPSWAEMFCFVLLAAGLGALAFL